MLITNDALAYPFIVFTRRLYTRYWILAKMMIVWGNVHVLKMMAAMVIIGHCIQGNP